MRIVRYAACALGAASLCFLVPAAQVHAEQSEVSDPQTIEYDLEDWLSVDTSGDSNTELKTYYINQNDTSRFKSGPYVLHYESNGFTEDYSLYFGFVYAEDALINQADPDGTDAAMSKYKHSITMDHITRTYNSSITMTRSDYRDIMTAEDLSDTSLSITGDSAGETIIDSDIENDASTVFYGYQYFDDIDKYRLGRTYAFNGDFMVNPIVTFRYNGVGDTDAYKKYNVTYNTTVAAPETNPTADGYVFTGWYTDPECTTLYDFSDDTKTITADMTLYAGWEKAPAADDQSKDSSTGSDSQKTETTGSNTAVSETTGNTADTAKTADSTSEAKTTVTNTNADSSRTSAKTGVGTNALGFSELLIGSVTAACAAMYLLKKH
ncbi:MAG: InlB B-repeat-containing protein [Lactimicrobium sp.]|uniref:InlB B-repeat-containing protein n=1 Tax=Lactimicrobium sp. TaxID=2563780 RepID=UPI002F354A3B